MSAQCEAQDIQRSHCLLIFYIYHGTGLDGVRSSQLCDRMGKNSSRDPNQLQMDNHFGRTMAGVCPTLCNWKILSVDQGNAAPTLWLMWLFDTVDTQQQGSPRLCMYGRQAIR
jgi:hypothetical protein